MKAVILAGGFATRLRPLSCSRPKTLFPIVNKPLLQWTFERLAKNNITEAILAANYETEIHIKQHRIKKAGVHVQYSHDPPKQPLGTAGPIKKARDLLGKNRTFLVLNGDIFADVNYTELLKNHENEGCTATIALHTVENPIQYGVAELTSDGRIGKFVEKPDKESKSNLINAGVYALDRKIFQLIPDGRAVSIEREVFPKLAEQNQLYGYVYDGLWADIGKPREFLEINKTLLDLMNQEKHGAIFSSNPTINNPVAMDNMISIGDKSMIGPYTVLGKNVSIGKNVQITDSVIFPDTRISDFSRITGAIIGQAVAIGKNAAISKGCVIGDNATIRDGVSLAENVSICPAVNVTENMTTSNRIC